MIAFSDMGFSETQWERRIIDGFKPDVVILAGDYDEGSEPDFYTEEEERARRKYASLYSFLEYAGRKTRVLVVGGNHDLAPFYSEDKVNSINGCEEISGKLVTVKSLSFLGVGASNVRILSILKKLGGRNIDVVVAHCGVNSLAPLWTRAKPKIVINGHTQSGTYKANGVPLLLTQRLRFAHVEIGDNGVVIQQFAEPNRLNDYEWLNNPRYHNKLEAYDFELPGVPRKVSFRRGMLGFYPGK